MDLTQPLRNTRERALDSSLCAFRMRELKAPHPSENSRPPGGYSTGKSIVNQALGPTFSARIRDSYLTFDPGLDHRHSIVFHHNTFYQLSFMIKLTARFLTTFIHLPHICLQT
jgi:hypothetical protein